MEYGKNFKNSETIQDNKSKSCRLQKVSKHDKCKSASDTETMHILGGAWHGSPRAKELPMPPSDWLTDVCFKVKENESACNNMSQTVIPQFQYSNIQCNQKANVLSTEIKQLLNISAA